MYIFLNNLCYNIPCTEDKDANMCKFVLITLKSHQRRDLLSDGKSLLFVGQRTAETLKDLIDSMLESE